jgi:hypothetical protein
MATGFILEKGKSMLDIKKLKTARELCVKIRWGIDDILRTSPADEKAEKLLNLMLISAEAIVGNIYEVKKKLELSDSGNCDKILDIVITTTPESWLNIRINSLLPNNRTVGSAKLLSAHINETIYGYTKAETLPYFEKAYLAIIEHCTPETCKSFDHDNKNLRVIPNCLKGIAFPDDDQFHLSLGIFTVYDEETYCEIYVLPLENADKFIQKYIKTYA